VLPCILCDIVLYEKNKNAQIVNWYYRVQNLYYRTTGNIAKAFSVCKNLLQYFENDEVLVSNFEFIYLKSICSFTKVCQLTGSYKELENCLNKIKLIYENKGNYTALEATCEIGVLHYLNTFQYNNAVKLANFINDEWPTISTKTFDGKLLWYCHSNLLLFWIADNDARFEYWLEKGLDIPRPNKGKAFYFGIRIFELISDFEKRIGIHFCQRWMH